VIGAASPSAAWASAPSADGLDRTLQRGSHRRSNLCCQSARKGGLPHKGLPSQVDVDGPGLAPWAKFRRTMGDASSEPGYARDQEQPRPDDDDSDGPCDALTGRCETFDGDSCRHDSHRVQVHDPDNEEDRRQAGTAAAAVEARRRPCRQAVPASAGNVRPRPGTSLQQAR